MHQKNSHTNVNFSHLGLSPTILERLGQLKFSTPTPIQQKAIPAAMNGEDIIGIAQTGTGKTLAFVIPIIELLARTKQQALIILPTRELATQVHETFGEMGQRLGLRSALLIGGSPMHRQRQEINRKPHVFIGTPGRTIDHMKNKILKLGNVGILVLDEADRMLDMGFAPQITSILTHVPPKHQTMLFSATIPPGIAKIANTYMKNPTRIEVAQTGTVAEHITQKFFVVGKHQKNHLLNKLLEEYQRTILIFSRTKHGTKRICRDIRHMGFCAAEIHSNLSQAQRRKSLEGFKSGRFPVLVATDIASRGIDVTNIKLVINYDLPDDPNDYVHRIGRTGRAGQAGSAISFVTPDQRSKIQHIERLIRERLVISPLPQLPVEQAKIMHHGPSKNTRNGPFRKHRFARERVRSKKREYRTA